MKKAFGHLMAATRVSIRASVVAIPSGVGPCCSSFIVRSPLVAIFAQDVGIGTLAVALTFRAIAFVIPARLGADVASEELLAFTADFNPH